MLDVALFAQDDALTHKLRQALESMDAKVERYTSWLSDSSICGTRQFDLMVVHPMSSVMDLASTWARGNRWAKPVATIALMPDQHMAFAPALLDAGFDRCLPLSLDNASLCAMVRALTRRSQGMTTSVCHYGALSFNHVTHQASVRDIAVDLTFREAQVLAILLKRVGDSVFGIGHHAIPKPREGINVVLAHRGASNGCAEARIGSECTMANFKMVVVKI